MLAAAPAARVGELAMAPGTLAALRGELARGAGARITRRRRTSPGCRRSGCALALPGRPPPAGFRGLLETALRRGLVEQDGPWLRLPTHRATLSPQQERLWAQLRPADRRPSASARRAPAIWPRALDLPEPAMRATLKRLQRMGRVVEVAPDHFFLRETVAEMAGIAAAIAAADADRIVTAAAFRDRLGNGRKVAIQILEFFDRAGVTRRMGDERRVRGDRVALFGPPGG